MDPAPSTTNAAHGDATQVLTNERESPRSIELEPELASHTDAPDADAATAAHEPDADDAEQDNSQWTVVPEDAIPISKDDGLKKVVVTEGTGDTPSLHARCLGTCDQMASICAAPSLITCGCRKSYTCVASSPQHGRCTSLTLGCMCVGRSALCGASPGQRGGVHGHSEGVHKRTACPTYSRQRYVCVPPASCALLCRIMLCNRLHTHMSTTCSPGPGCMAPQACGSLVHGVPGQPHDVSSQHVATVVHPPTSAVNLTGAACLSAATAGLQLPQKDTHSAAL
jgi:hypothetical protein